MNKIGEFILYLAIGVFLGVFICAPTYFLYRNQELINRVRDITIKEVEYNIKVSTRLTKTETRLDSLESRVIQKLGHED